MKFHHARIALLLLAMPVLAQVYTTPPNPIATSGGTVKITNLYGGMNATFEELITGGPASTSITIQGCMKGDTCDTAADTNTATTSTIRGVAFTKPYSYFLVTASWTGGTAVQVQVNPVITTARSGSGGAGGTGVTSASSLTNNAIMTGAGLQASQTPSATSTLDASGNMSLAGTLTATLTTATGLPLNGLVGANAAATLTESAAGDPVTFAGVETGNLTAPYVFTDANSTNNNTNIGAIVGATGSSTGGIGLLVFDASGTGDILEAYTGGSVAAGVYTVGTKEFSVNSSGQVAAVGAITSSVGFQGNTANVATKVQAGVDGNATGATAALTVRGQTVTAGSTASIAGGAITLSGGDNGSSGATETGGAATLRGGDTTNASAAANTPGSVTIRGGNASSTGSSTASTVSITGGAISGAATNIAGGDVTIASGLGTGNATPSKVFLKDPAFVSASGTAAQSQVTRFVQHAKAGSTTTATATNMFQIPVAVNQTIGIEVVVHVETTQATPQNCSTTEEFFLAVQNTASTITSQSTAGTTATICSTGTLTIATAFSAATPAVFSVTPSWTTIAPSGVIITISLRNLSQQEVTLL